MRTTFLTTMEQGPHLVLFGQKGPFSDILLPLDFNGPNIDQSGEKMLSLSFENVYNIAKKLQIKLQSICQMV